MKTWNVLIICITILIITLGVFVAPVIVKENRVDKCAKKYLKDDYYSYESARIYCKKAY